VQPVQQVALDRQVQPVQQAWLVLPAQRERQEQLGQQVPLAQAVPQARPVPLAQPAQRVQPARRGQPAVRVNSARPDLLDNRVLPAQPAQQVS
jgi:hypothetical protein